MSRPRGTLTQGPGNACCPGGKQVPRTQWWTERAPRDSFATFSILFHVNVLLIQNGDPLLIFKFSNAPFKKIMLCAGLNSQ